MSAVVGSIPSLTRSGRSSTAPRAAPRAGRRPRSASDPASGAMLDCRLRATGAARVQRFLLDGRPRTKAPAGQRRASAPPPSPPPKSKPRLKKLRVLFVLLGLGVLAVVSMVFGMMAAVSQDLPAIYDFAQYKASKNSVLVDATGEEIGTLSSDQNKILLSSGQISPNVKNAVVSIEDARFYEHNGVDFQGIGRALVKDILSASAAQGASTITQQFVKNALEAQGDRTLFVKFKEAALAYRLEHHWSKDKILTEYLNTIYFGEGAYGIEAAARTYFGSAHPGCGTEAEPCASVLEPWEAAMLAGIIQSPSAYDPKIYPENALFRRNVVLEKMAEQGYISEDQLREDQEQALPSKQDIEPPTLDSRALLHRLPAPAAGRPLRPFESVLRRPDREVDARPAAAGSRRRSGQLLPRLLARDRLGGRDRQPQCRDQGDGRRPRLRHQAVQPGDPGAPPAGLLDQALHPADGARTGDLAGNRLSLRRTLLPLREKGPENVPGGPTTRAPISAPARSSARPPTPTTRSTRRWRWKGWKERPSATRPGRLPAPSTRPATRTRSRPTRRWSSAASLRA